MDGKPAALRYEMRVTSGGKFCSSTLMGGCLLPSLFLCPASWADTVSLKNGKDLKGLVVEQHADRVILSTADGEIPILLKRIQDIQYDDPAQNFVKVGKSYEAKGRYGEALAYYEKALEVNPGFQEAQVAATGLRSRFWSVRTEGPRNEIEKQQAIHDSWNQGRPLEALIREETMAQARAVRENLGLDLEKKGDWVRLGYVDPQKSAHLAGLRKNDRLTAIDGKSQRYLSVEVVQRNLLVPRYTNFTLEFERDCFLNLAPNAKQLKSLGFELKLEYEGLLVSSVKKRGPAWEAGLREGDLLIAVDQAATRYMPLKKVTELILQRSAEDQRILTVRRSALLARR